MLGSHNSFTCLKAVNKDIFNKFTKYWRCQYKTVQEQYEAGVRFFDIRVTAETVKQGNKDRQYWRVCHGAVNVDQLFASLSTCANYFKSLGPDVRIRILLEKGSDDVKELFKTDVEKVLKRYKSLITQIVIKKGWMILFEDWKGLQIHDYCYIPWNSGKSFWYNIKHFTGSTIESWAKEHNPVITQEMIDDKTNLYFMDYV